MSDDEISRMARELDQMERDVTSEEANVLERVLEALADGKKPKIKDAEKIRAMHVKYLQREDDESELGSDESSEEEEELDL